MKKLFFRIAVVCIMVGGLFGCFSITHTDCSWVRPIIRDVNDVLTPETKAQIISHNEAWENYCLLNQ